MPRAPPPRHGTIRHVAQVEASVRNFVNDTEKFTPLLLCAYPKPFRWPWPLPPAAAGAHCQPPTAEHVCSFFIGWMLKPDKSAQKVDLKRCRDKWLEQTKSKAERGGWWAEGMVVELRSLRRRELPSTSFMPTMEGLAGVKAEPAKILAVEAQKRAAEAEALAQAKAKAEEEGGGEAAENKRSAEEGEGGPEGAPAAKKPALGVISISMSKAPAAPAPAAAAAAAPAAAMSAVAATGATERGGSGETTAADDEPAPDSTALADLGRTLRFESELGRTGTAVTARLAALAKLALVQEPALADVLGQHVSQSSVAHLLLVRTQCLGAAAVSRLCHR
jgi:hypothetical protein